MDFPLREKELPAIIRQVVSNAPDNRKIPCLVACLSPLCALASRVRLHYYYDSRPSALLLQVIIEGNQAVGKSFAANIERLIMDTTLKVHDKQQRRIEQEYREKRKHRRANEKLEEPKTTIRVIPATISKTVLTKRADYYERTLGAPATFWMFADELDEVTDAGRQGYSNLRTVMRTAYDLGSHFGMDYASDNSYSAIVDINICSMFCATPSAVDDYMDRRAIEGGNCSRQILCRLGDELGADGAFFKDYTEEQLAAINAMLHKLMADTYDSEGNLQSEIWLDTSWIDGTVQHWCQQKGKEALLSGSMAIDVFRKRSSVSAYRCASLCYYLYLLEADIDCRRERAHKHPTMKQAVRHCKKIYLYLADYILTALLERWGSRFEQLNAKRDEETVCCNGKSLYDDLPEVFSREQLDALLKLRGRRTPTRILICQWSKRGLIAPVGENRYRKVRS